uniref:Protein FAM18B n=1 Tax=Solanum tuberosum TaxID=4113 RepID=M1CK19_SOLTU
MIRHRESIDGFLSSVIDRLFYVVASLFEKWHSIPALFYSQIHVSIARISHPGGRVQLVYV